jgi:hypothetical protein
LVSFIHKHKFIAIFSEGTIHSKRYVEQIICPFIKQLLDKECKHAFFQQDHTTAHTARTTSMDTLKKVIWDIIVSVTTPPTTSYVTSIYGKILTKLKN